MGLKIPVPSEATSIPGSVAVHDERVPMIVRSARPAAINASPVPSRTAGLIRVISLALAPETMNTSVVPGR